MSLPEEPRTALSLELVADPTLLGTVRSFASAAARIAHCADDVLDDVKLAASEACTDAIRRAAPRARVTFDADVGASIVFTVSGPSGSAKEHDGTEPDHLSIIDALFPGASRSEQGTTSTLVFEVPRSVSTVGD